MAGEQRETSGIVMAAGHGTRLKSDLPKVLHRAAGRPLLAHVLAALQPLELRDRVVVVSADRDEIEQSVRSSGLSEGISYAVQDRPAGTGDAVRVALESLTDRLPQQLLVLPGDGPLITSRTLAELLEVHAANGAAVTLLTARLPQPVGGRVVRASDGSIEKIVEEQDASDDERGIDEINGGVYVFETELLSHVIGKLDRENAQAEYYLTDAIGLLRSEGHEVAGLVVPPEEVAGVNDRAQLAIATQLLRERAARRWMAEGVTIVDPRTTYIDPAVEIGRDAVIHPFTFLEGATRIGEGAEVGPQCRIVDSTIHRAAIVTFAVVRGSDIGPEASVGPYASLRPGTKLERGAHLGTFVETKQTTLGEGSKANHLAYLGDAEIGSGVNVGAGTITCNWDGRQKHKTVIEDDAYISSDTMLVAPVRIGKRAATGAGSVVRDDVPDDALAVGVPARLIEGKGNKMKRSTDEDEASRDNQSATEVKEGEA